MNQRHLSDNQLQKLAQLGGPSYQFNYYHKQGPEAVKNQYFNLARVAKNNPSENYSARLQDFGNRAASAGYNVSDWNKELQL